MKSRIPGRVFAPLALIVVALAIVFIVSISSGADDSKSSGTTSTATTTKAKAKTTGTTTTKAKPKVYVVKQGDLLSTIAEKTGVPIEKIEMLNPDLDPQVLIPGQSIKIGP